MNTCVYSSLVFLTNVVAARLTGEYIYGTAWLALTCSSVAFHSSRGTKWYIILFWADQACLFCVFFCGLCIFCVKPMSITKCLAILCFFSDVYIHYLSPPILDSGDADKWHSIIHYIGSLGHHCLLL
jgi:hypothetical protein